MTRSTRRTSTPQLCAMSVALEAQGDSVPRRGATTTTATCAPCGVAGIRRAVGEQALDGGRGRPRRGAVAGHPVHVPRRDGGEAGGDPLQPGEQRRGAERGEGVAARDGGQHEVVRRGHGCGLPVGVERGGCRGQGYRGGRRPPHAARPAGRTRVAGALATSRWHLDDDGRSGRPVRARRWRHSRVVVLGGTGEMGTALTEVLRGRGHDVVAASRATGVDVTTGAGLDDALAGADTVVDCLNDARCPAAPRSPSSSGAARAGPTAAAGQRDGVGHVRVTHRQDHRIVQPHPRRCGPVRGYHAGVALVPGWPADRVAGRAAGGLPRRGMPSRPVPARALAADERPSAGRGVGTRRPSARADGGGRPVHPGGPGRPEPLPGLPRGTRCRAAGSRSTRGGSLDWLTEA